MPNKLNKHYVSPADQFLSDFDANHPLSPSQKSERDKHQALFEKRDTPQPTKTIETLWKDF